MQIPTSITSYVKQQLKTFSSSRLKQHSSRVRQATASNTAATRPYQRQSPSSTGRSNGLVGQNQTVGHRLPAPDRGCKDVGYVMQETLKSKQIIPWIKIHIFISAVEIDAQYLYGTLYIYLDIDIHL